jgi:hypothetical protein
MSFTNITSPANSVLTDKCSTENTRAIAGDTSFKLKGWNAGRDGYDMGDPTQPLSVTTTDTNLIDPIYPSSTPGDHTTFLGFEHPDSTTLVVVCRIDRSDCSYALGEIGIWFETVDDVVPGNIGDIWLGAISHFPIICKTTDTVLVFKITIPLL